MRDFIRLKGDGECPIVNLGKDLPKLGIGELPQITESDMGECAILKITQDRLRGCVIHGKIVVRTFP